MANFGLERCETCPVREKYLLYKEAGYNRLLATRLAFNQRTLRFRDILDPSDLYRHFDRTADTLLIGCKSEILCEFRGRLPWQQKEK